MKISWKEWVLCIFVAILCLGFWYQLGFTRFTFIDLSIDRKVALQKAESYLSSKGVNPKGYLKAIVFSADNTADRYLQGTIGIKAEEDFLQAHSYELFAWYVRFFKELQKEEYTISVSPRTGNILSFSHAIEDIEAREEIGKDSARLKAEDFLRETYGLNLENYDFHEEGIKRYENRIDYGFSWEKKGVYIPWEEGGGAKLLIGATISGNEIRDFYKARLDVPEKYLRDIQKYSVVGEYLYSLSLILFIILVSWSIYIALKRRHTLVIRSTKKWFICLFIFFVIFSLLDIFNNIQGIIISYPTTTTLDSFVVLYLIKVIINLIFLSAIFIVPGLAGESLHSEVMPQNKLSSFLYYIRSTFFGRTTARSILLGYVWFFIIIGFQAIIFLFGQRYFGVCREWVRLTQLSSSYIPFLSAFVIAMDAGLSEEIIFRLFGIPLAKRYLKNTVLAVIFTSLAWGLGHSLYAIFPMWFRSIEVTLIGVLFGFMFFRYGIISVITTHYLVDVFLSISAYIFGKSHPYLFIGSMVTFSLPLLFAAIAYFVNKKEEEGQLHALLDRVERYNLNILKVFVSAKKTQGIAVKEIRNELLSHNWDNILIELAIKDVFGEAK